MANRIWRRRSSHGKHGTIWKPVWVEWEPHRRLHLAQAQSNKAAQGRKSDLADAKRWLRRLAAGERRLSFIPKPEQRSRRMVTRGLRQLVRERVQLQNQIESLLEEGRIKRSPVISDLLGASGRRILRAVANGEKSPKALAAWGDRNLKCGWSCPIDARSGSLRGIQPCWLSQHLHRVEWIDRQIEELNQLAAAQMRQHQNVVTWLVEIP